MHYFPLTSSTCPNHPINSYRLNSNGRRVQGENEMLLLESWNRGFESLFFSVMLCTFRP
jgi:hypothetical protein